ncbi:MAG TPA: YkgJ family cysteine cluster protein [Desulfuromonadaceae bacterium]|nr:YkgJ family cysteine cluster protein [Desulfuromonadaceae bacterium]
MAGPIDLLCLQCGLCCNGVLFADVRPERGDDSRLFQQYGLRVPQPCPAFNAGDCKCAVYSDRPQRCRKFECKQLIAVQAGQKASAAALTKIREAKKLVRTVEGLLDTLGFNDPRLSLNKRFQRCQKAAERGVIASDNLGSLADLQLAVHRLNTLLAREFYG